MGLKINPVRLAVFMGLVYAFTVAFQFSQPVTGGYFNFGEAAIYVCALISDPLTAGLAGGIGSSLADATTGYGIFAPATLVIKFAEGYLASLLFRQIGKSKGKISTLAVGFIYMIAISVIGGKYMSGSASFSVMSSSYSFFFPWEIWVMLGVGIMAALIVLERRMKASGEFGSLLLAGLVMVAGYFLYEYFVSNPLTGRPRIAAVAEVPVNFGQALVGAMVAIPAYAFLKKAGYVEGEESDGGQDGRSTE